MTAAEIPSNVFISGVDMPLPRIDLPALEGEPEQPGAAQPAAGQAAAAEAQRKQSLREFLEANPDARAELDREFVVPARTAAEANATAQARARLAYDTLQSRQNDLTDRLLSAKPEQIAGIQTELRQVRQQLVEHQQAESTRAARERQYALAAMKEIFGLTDDQLAQMPAAQSAEGLRDWALKQSPVVQSAVQAAMKQAGADTQAVEAAQSAARFGQRLQQTPAPSSGAQAAETPRNSRTFEQVEQDFLRGKVSYADYAKARASNPNIRARI